MITEELNSSPELLNSEPYDRDWLLKVEITHLEELDHLLDANAYQAYRGG